MQGRNRIIMHTYKVCGINGIKCAVSRKKELVPRSKFQTLDSFSFFTLFRKHYIPQIWKSLHRSRKRWSIQPMRESVQVQDRGLCDKYWPIISFLECQIIISNSFCWYAWPWTDSFVSKQVFASLQSTLKSEWKEDRTTVGGQLRKSVLIYKYM